MKSAVLAGPQFLLVYVKVRVRDTKSLHWLNGTCLMVQLGIRQLKLFFTFCASIEEKA